MDFKIFECFKMSLFLGIERCFKRNRIEKFFLPINDGKRPLISPVLCLVYCISDVAS